MVSNFSTDIDAFVDANLGAAARSKALGDLAIQERTSLIQSGNASIHYTTTVDGNVDPNEYDVKGTGGGIINYHFSYLADAVEFALAFLQGRVTHVTGQLSQSFWISVNGTYLPPGTTPDYANMPVGAQIVIGNTAAYWRKADVNYIGTKQMKYRGPNVLNDCVSAVKRQFGSTAITAKRLADWNFPDKYKPVARSIKSNFVYQSPVIVLSET